MFAARQIRGKPVAIDRVSDLDGYGELSGDTDTDQEGGRRKRIRKMRRLSYKGDVA